MLIVLAKNLQERSKKKNARGRVATRKISHHHYIVQLQLFVSCCIGRGSKRRLETLTRKRKVAKAKKSVTAALKTRSPATRSSVLNVSLTPKT